MLGFSGGRHTTNSHFGTVNSTFAMDDVRCLGNETTILACPHTTQENCGVGEGAGVICHEDTVALITGGIRDAALLSTNEVFPTSDGCDPPPSLGPRVHHQLFLTLEVIPRIAACGGEVAGRVPTASCLVFNRGTQTWDANIMSDLLLPRVAPAVITLNDVGTYMIGGGPWASWAKTSSDFLPRGGLRWVSGPPLPVTLGNGPCAVQISQMSLLGIWGPYIREYQVNRADPVSEDGWQDNSKWPRLKTAREYVWCTTIKSKVVISGGRWFGEIHHSTEVLNVETRQIEYAGNLNRPRYGLRIITIASGGRESILALGGSGENSHSMVYNSVEEFNPETLTWSLVPATLLESRSIFGVLVVPKSFFCHT